MKLPNDPKEESPPKPVELEPRREPRSPRSPRPPPDVPERPPREGIVDGSPDGKSEPRPPLPKVFVGKDDGKMPPRPHRPPTPPTLLVAGDEAEVALKDVLLADPVEGAIPACWTMNWAPVPMSGPVLYLSAISLMSRVRAISRVAQVGSGNVE